jgi:hypothetical protein
MAALKLILDDFIKNVRPDPKSTDPIIFMSGFLGESPVEGNVRVYADPQLSSFMDVPRSAILYAVQNTKDEDSLGGSKIWVRQSDLGGQAGYAGSYLEGDIYTNYTTNMFQPGGGIQPAFTLPFACTRTTPIDPLCRITLPHVCLTLPFRCPTQLQIRSLCRPCVTHYNNPLCRTINLVQCRSMVVICPITRNAPCELQTARCSLAGCPSWVDGCPTAPTDFTTVVNPGTFQTIYDAGAFNPYMHGAY